MTATATTRAVGAGPVVLTLPPVAAMARVGRLTASSVASLADLSIDDIDDIKIAVSEMITLLIQSGARTAITLRFEVTPDQFSVEATTPAAQFDLGRDDIALATAVLDAVSDQHDVGHVDQQLLVRVIKHRSEPAEPDDIDAP